MVTRNWYNLMKTYRYRISNKLTIVNKTGEAWNIRYSDDKYVIPALALSPTSGLKFSIGTYESGVYYILGRGTTPATVDDYNLEDMITSGLSCAWVIDEDEDKDAIHKLTLTNTSNDDITIGEIGIAGNVNVAGNWYLALLERTVLDKPITVPAGGFGQIEYAIKLPIPTA
jgi:hypothetical protein